MAKNITSKIVILVLDSEIFDNTEYVWFDENKPTVYECIIVITLRFCNVRKLPNYEKDVIYYSASTCLQARRLIKGDISTKLTNSLFFKFKYILLSKIGKNFSLSPIKFNLSPIKF